MTTVSLATCFDQLGLPAQTTAQEGERKNPKLTGNQKGLKVKKATNSGLNSLPQRQLYPHGVSLKYARKLGKKTQKTKKQKQKTLTVQDNEEIEVFNHSGKGSVAYLQNGGSLLYFNPCKMLGWTVRQLTNENLFLYSVVHMVD